MTSRPAVPAPARVRLPAGGRLPDLLRSRRAARLLSLLLFLAVWQVVVPLLPTTLVPTLGETRQRCQRYLEMVGLDDVGGKYPGQLSGGMQQRAGIARALSIEPDVLLMDEPFSHLDAITGRTLRRELHQIWMQAQKTVLFVTHDVGEAVELSTRILLFGKDGHLREQVDIDLPFPRDPTADEVALAKADLLRRFDVSSNA